jgi:hypothetical protein
MLILTEHNNPFVLPVAGELGIDDLTFDEAKRYTAELMTMSLPVIEQDVADILIGKYGGYFKMYDEERVQVDVYANTLKLVSIITSTLRTPAEIAEQAIKESDVKDTKLRERFHRSIRRANRFTFSVAPPEKETWPGLGY